MVVLFLKGERMKRAKIKIEEIREEVTQCRIIQIDKKLNKAKKIKSIEENNEKYKNRKR